MVGEPSACLSVFCTKGISVQDLMNNPKRSLPRSFRGQPPSLIRRLWFFSRGRRAAPFPSPFTPRIRPLSSRNHRPPFPCRDIPPPGLSD